MQKEIKMALKVIKKNKNPIKNVDQYYDKAQTVTKVFHLYRGVDLKITYMTVKDYLKDKHTNIIKPVKLEFFSDRGYLNPSYNIPIKVLHYSDEEFKTSDSYDVFYSDSLKRNEFTISASNDVQVAFDKTAGITEDYFKIHRPNLSVLHSSGPGFGYQFFNNGNKIKSSIAVEYHR